MRRRRQHAPPRRRGARDRTTAAVVFEALGSPGPAMAAAAALLSEQVLSRSRGLIDRLEVVGEALTEALREENRKIKALQAEEPGESQRRERMVQHILLRKILSVDRGDSGKLLRGIKALMESVVAIALSVRAEGVMDAADDEPAGGSNAETNASTALTLVGGQLDVAEQRLVKIELRAGQLQLIGGPRLDGALSDDSEAADGNPEASTDDGVDAEADALASLADHPARGMDRGWLLRLRSMVAEMRVLESSVEFHTALLSAHRKLATNGTKSEDAADEIGQLQHEHQKQQPLQYSRTNFSYGSTPHSSWLALFEHCAPLRAAVDDMLALRGVSDSRSVDEYCVFGSSLGWLCFYGCLTFGLRCVGYELVQPLVSLSNRLAECHGIGSRDRTNGHSNAGSVAFHHMDMLAADLRRVRILVLTSHVWDTHLLERLDEKLAKEVPPVCFATKFIGLEETLCFLTTRIDAPQTCT